MLRNRDNRPGVALYTAKNIAVIFSWRHGRAAAQRRCAVQASSSREHPMRRGVHRAVLLRMNASTMSAALRALTLGAVVLIGLAVVASPGSAQQREGGKPPLVFAAASLKNALDAAAADFKQDTGHAVVISYAASSALARQMEGGAPADIFISADLDWMDWLQQRNLINTSSRETLLANTLVLIAPADAKTDFKIATGANLGAALGGDRLAVGEVSSVPAGKYAKEALEKLGMWQGVAAKLAPTADVRVALNLVARGEAAYGIVYATDAAAEPKVRVVDTFPASSHPPILYPAALTATSKSADAAAFLKYLRSPKAMHEFTSQGFTMAGP
jgi:molybdate transport system substrate-binding protein